MQYEPIYTHTGYRITESYRFGDELYNAEFVIGRLGYVTGLAGYDPYFLTIKLKDVSGSSIGTIHCRFPQVLAKDTDNPKRMLKPETQRNNTGKREFTSYASRQLQLAVEAFLEERLLYKTIDRTCDEFTFNLQ
ncbi:MAG: hypothetical protein AB7D92_10490 [Sphaerochaeta sp.]